MYIHGSHHSLYINFVVYNLDILQDYKENPHHQNKPLVHVMAQIVIGKYATLVKYNN